MKFFSAILFLILSNALLLHGQKENSCLQPLFIHRPLVKCDSEAIIKNHVSEIRIYSRIVDDSIPEKNYIGKWAILIENGKIRSTKWIADSSFHKDQSYNLYACGPQLKIEYKKNKIIQTLGMIQFSGSARPEVEDLQFTHLINKYGRIYATSVLHLYKEKVRMEDSFLFKKIDYVYAGDFLVESDYTTDGCIIESDEPFIRLYFEYSR